MNQIKSRLESMGKFKFYSLLDSKLYQNQNKIFPDNEIKCLEKQYESFFDIFQLKNELHVMYSSAEFKDKLIFEIIKYMSVNKLDSVLKEVYKLAKLIVTILSTTASAERTFSALKNKNNLRRFKINPAFYSKVTEKFVKEEKRIDFINKKNVNVTYFS